jgi:predicted DNA-binding protein with PD1-like motif
MKPLLSAGGRLLEPHTVWSKVHLTNVEALGCGTLGHDPETDRVLPHIHTSVGLKERSALGHTSHLLSARVQFLVEMLLVEITTPAMLRIQEPAQYDVPLLRFDS